MQCLDPRLQKYLKKGLDMKYLKLWVMEKEDNFLE